MTVASPPIDALEIQMRARSVEDAIRSARSPTDGRQPSISTPVSIVYTFPLTLSQPGVTEVDRSFPAEAERAGFLQRARLITGRGFIGVDGGDAISTTSTLQTYLKQFIATRLHASEFDPDVTEPVIIRDPSETHAKAGDRGGREIFLRAARRFHRPDRAHAARRSADFARGTQGRPATGRLSRLFAGAAGVLRHCSPPIWAAS